MISPAGLEPPVEHALLAGNDCRHGALGDRQADAWPFGPPSTKISWPYIGAIRGYALVIRINALSARGYRMESKWRVLHGEPLRRQS